jgi:hypothetical protein
MFQMSMRPHLSKYVVCSLLPVRRFQQWILRTLLALRRHTVSHSRLLWNSDSYVF